MLRALVVALALAGCADETLPWEVKTSAQNHVEVFGDPRTTACTDSGGCAVLVVTDTEGLDPLGAGFLFVLSCDGEDCTTLAVEKVRPLCGRVEIPEFRVVPRSRPKKKPQLRGTSL